MEARTPACPPLPQGATRQAGAGARPGASALGRPGRRCPLPPGPGTAGPFIVERAGRVGEGLRYPRSPAGCPSAELRTPGPGKTVPTAPPPGGAGSRLPHSGKLPRLPPGCPDPVQPSVPARPHPRPRGPAAQARPVGGRSAHRRASRPQAAGGRARPAGHSFNSAFFPEAGLRCLPPVPSPLPVRTAARQRHPAASRNLTPSSASCAPPRPADNFLRPTSERAGLPDGPAEKEGSPRRASGPPEIPPDGEGRWVYTMGCTRATPLHEFCPAHAPGARPDFEGPRPRRRLGALPGEGPPRRRVTRGAAGPGPGLGSPTARPARGRHRSRARPSFLPAA